MGSICNVRGDIPHTHFWPNVASAHSDLEFENGCENKALFGPIYQLPLHNRTSGQPGCITRCRNCTSWLVVSDGDVLFVPIQENEMGGVSPSPHRRAGGMFLGEQLCSLINAPF